MPAGRGVLGRRLFDVWVRGGDIYVLVETTASGSSRLVWLRSWMCWWFYSPFFFLFSSSFSKNGRVYATLLHLPKLDTILLDSSIYTSERSACLYVDRAYPLQALDRDLHLHKPACLCHIKQLTSPLGTDSKPHWQFSITRGACRLTHFRFAVGWIKM